MLIYCPPIDTLWAKLRYSGSATLPGESIKDFQLCSRVCLPDSDWPCQKGRILINAPTHPIAPSLALGATKRLTPLSR